MKKFVIILLVGVCAIGLFVFAADTQTDFVAQSAYSTLGVAPHKVATSTLLVSVSGMVTASDATIIRAQTAGVMADISVTEGSVVKSGQLLASQSVPVLAAYAGLRNAEQNLSSVQRNQSTAGYAAEAAQSAASAAYQAERIAVELPAAERRLAELTTETQRMLVSARTQIINLLEYVANNKRAFSADVSSRERLLIATLYGRTPSYLSNILVPKQDDGGPAWFVDDQYGVISRSTTEVVQDVEQALAVAEELQAIIASADEYYLDAREVSVDSVAYDEYFTRRDDVASLILILQQRVTGLVTQRDAVRVLTSNLTGNQSVIDVGVVGTRAVFEMSQNVATAGTGVVEAARSLSDAELGQSQPRAPYSGIVTRLFVEQGEYVVPGTPLLSLVGEGAREIEVYVPRAAVPLISIGAPFTVAGQVVGVVDRIVSEDVRGVARVFVSLTTVEEWAIGEVLSGSLTVEVPLSAGYIIPRTHLWFGALGPYIKTAHDHQLVTILYDADEYLWVQTDTTLEDATLEPVTTVAW